MKTLLVRVQPRSGQETFFRCGIKFGREWQSVDVDDATAARLEAEQMLEVVEEVEEVFEPLFADVVAQLSAPATSDRASSLTDADASTAGPQTQEKEASAPQATTPAEPVADAMAPATTPDSASALTDADAPTAGPQAQEKEASAPQATTPADAAALAPAKTRKAGK